MVKRGITLVSMVVAVAVLQLGTLSAWGATDQWSGIGPFGVNVNTLAIDPTTPATLYSGTAGGGVFKSLDGGGSWSPMNSGLVGADVSILTVNPVTSSTLYAGTSAGVFKSVDGGGSWSGAGAGLPDSSIRTMILEPAAPSILYLGTSAGVFKSSDGGGSWSGINTGLTTTDVRSLALAGSTLYAGTSGGGVFRSSDGGGSWSGVNSGLGNAYVLSLAVNPATPTTLYAGSSAGLFKSVNGGGSWSSVNSGLTNLSVQTMAVDPVTPSTLYAGTSSGLFKSLDGGGNWFAAGSGMTATNVRALVLNPVAPATLYAGICDDYGGVNGGGVYKSVTGGDGWSVANRGLTCSFVSALAIDPANPANLFAGTAYNGLFRSMDGGGSWSSVNTGMTNTAMEVLAINPVIPAPLFAGTAAGLFKSLDGGGSWNDSGAGLTDLSIQALAMDPLTPATLYVGTWSALFKSLDGGGSWSVVGTGMTTTDVSSLALNPANPAILYAGTAGGGVFRSSDGGGSWSGVNSGLGNSHVTVLGINPVAPATLYAGTSGGGLFKSLDGGGSWNGVNAGLTDPMIQTMAVDPLTPATLYVGTPSGVFRSLDGGSSWSAVGSGMSFKNVHSLAVAGTAVYAGTYGGGIYRLAQANMDATPPAVIAMNPLSGASGVDTSVVITAGFSEAMNSATITGTTFTLSSGNGAVAGIVSYDSVTRSAGFTPMAPLGLLTTYTATITTGVRDLAGNPPAVATSWNFTTGSQGIILSENFDGGVVPAGWTLAHNGVTTTEWSFTNPGIRANFTGGEGGFAVIDSDHAGGVNVDAELRTPLLNLSGMSEVLLEFRTDFNSNSSEIAQVEVSVNGAAGPWSSVWHSSGVSYRTVVAESIDLTPLAAYKPAVMIRFHYYKANNDWWWELDDLVVRVTAAPDTTAPTGGIIINNGAPYSGSTAVTLALAASDSVGVAGYYLSATSTPPLAGASGWSPVTVTTSYMATLPYTLSGGDGAKSLYVWYKDGAGNVSPTAGTGIILDGTAPADGVLTAAAGNGQAVLTWSGFSDGGSGIGGYILVSSSLAPPVSCTNGVTLYSGAAATFTPTGLTNGGVYYYRVCAVDAVGNRSAGATVIVTPHAPVALAATIIGSGSVNSITAGVSFACSSGVCGAGYDPGVVLTLRAAPGSGSLFTGWSGDCGGEGDCALAMTSNKGVTATFTAAPKVRVGAKEFVTLQAAYDDTATTNSSVIRMLGGTLAGPFIAGRNSGVTLEGGYDAAYAAVGGWTVLQSPVVLKSGRVLLKGITVR